MYNYKIGGIDGFAELTVDLGDGQPIKAEGGVMSHMDGTVEMETKSGGFMKGLKRSMSGESFFQNTFTGPGKITFAPSLPGDIIPLEINPGPGWIMQKDAYLASSPDVEVSSKFGGMKSMFGGEGAFLTHLSTETSTGLAFLGGYGAIVKHEVPAGKEFVVDNGIFFATEATTQFKTSKVGGKKSFMFGGEGLVMRFFGPCTVFTQSRGQRSLAQYIMGMMPKR
jgi:uncharacterized protein (TIGR00266 family)